MKYTQLGATDLRVSHIALGGATFSNIYGTFEEQRGIELLKETLKQGINYVETGPWYGQGTSERTIGKALKDVPRNSFYIGSKIGRYDKDTANMFDFSAEKTEAGVESTLRRLGLQYVDLIQALKDVPRNSFYIGSKIGRYDKDTANMFDFSAEKTEAGVESTLRRLGLQYVDLIQVHDLTFAPDKCIVLKETLPALARAVADGRARYIGLADYDLDLMQEIVEESDVKISTVLSYAKSTLLDNRLQNYISYFKSKEVGVINAAATGMGLLCNTGPQPWHPASDDVKALCKQASDYCRAQNVELARLATWFTLSQTGIDTNVCGFFNLSQLAETVAVLEKGLTDREQTVLAELQYRYFDNITLHWDNVELPAYKEKLQNLNI